MRRGVRAAVAAGWLWLVLIACVGTRRHVDPPPPPAPVGAQSSAVPTARGVAGDTGGPRTGRVEREWDEFDQEWETRLVGMRVFLGSQPASVRMLHIDGDRAAALMITTLNERWRYLECHRLQFVADGEPVVTTESQHHGEVLSGRVSEMVAVAIPELELARMARADEVRGRLCNDELRFTAAQRQKILEFGAAAWQLEEAARASAADAGTDAGPSVDGGVDASQVIP